MPRIAFKRKLSIGLSCAFAAVDWKGVVHDLWFLHNGHHTQKIFLREKLEKMMRIGAKLLRLFWRNAANWRDPLKSHKNHLNSIGWFTMMLPKGLQFVHVFSPKYS